MMGAIDEEIARLHTCLSLGITCHDLRGLLRCAPPGRNAQRCHVVHRFCFRLRSSNFDLKPLVYLRVSLDTKGFRVKWAQNQKYVVTNDATELECLEEAAADGTTWLPSLIHLGQKLCCASTPFHTLTASQAEADRKDALRLPMSRYKPCTALTRHAH